MSARATWLVCCLAVFLPASWSPGAEMVRLMGLEGRVEQGSPRPAVFGNSEQGLELEVETPTSQSGALHADLFQIAGELAIPLAKDVHLQEAITLQNKYPQPVRVSIKFPEVKQRAEILVRLFVIPNTPPAAAFALGDLRFEVFPASVTKDLADLLKSNQDGPLRTSIFGSGRKLRDFFKSIPIPFEDGGESTPESLEPDRFYFVETSDDTQVQAAMDRRTGIRMVIFAPDDSLPPGIFSERDSSGVFIRVTLPLLDNVKVDPRAQLQLIKIIHLLTAPTSVTPPALNP